LWPNNPASSAAANLPTHLRFAQPRGLGQKVSDEFTVPLCREHHRELHRAGKERDWWSRNGLENYDFKTSHH